MDIPVTYISKRGHDYVTRLTLTFRFFLFFAMYRHVRHIHSITGSLFIWPGQNSMYAFLYLAFESFLSHPPAPVLTYDTESEWKECYPVLWSMHFPFLFTITRLGWLKGFFQVLPFLKRLSPLALNLAGNRTGESTNFMCEHSPVPFMIRGPLLPKRKEKQKQFAHSTVDGTATCLCIHSTVCS